MVGLAAALAATAPAAADRPAGDAEAAASGALEARSVVVVRHAEKACGACDCELTGEGVERSRRLRHTLGEAPIFAVLYTNCRRTLQTARPLVKLCRRAGHPKADCAIKIDHDVRGETRPPAEEAEEVERELLGLFRSMRKGTAVVVSHGEVIPPLLERFCGVRPEPVAYDDLFLLDVRLGTRISCTAVHHLRYGAAAD